MNLILRIIRYVKHWYMLMTHYWESTHSIDMMWRIFLTECVTVLNSIFFDKFHDFIYVIYRFCNKEILFKTPWWSYLAHTRNAWMITQPGYEVEIREVINRNIEKHKHSDQKIFIDIWAHVGRYVIELAKNYEYFSVGFEPSPETFRALQINTLLSKVENRVRLYNIGLSDAEWTVDFEYFASHDGGSRVLQSEDKNSKFAQKISVPVVAFDRFDHWIIPENVALILIDVEWYELNVLKWMQEFLSKIPPSVDLVVEIFETNPKRGETIEFLDSLGFKGEMIEKDNWHFVRK